MRALAGSIVVLAGALLWGAGACAKSMVYMAGGGNVGTAELATYGGMVVVAVGCALSLAAAKGSDSDRR